MITAPERAGALNALDRYREWEAAEVPLDDVHPTQDEMAAYCAADKSASLEGWKDVMVAASQGRVPTLTVRRYTDGSLWVDAAEISGPEGALANSLATLEGMRAAGVKRATILVVSERMEKQDEEDGEQLEDVSWMLPPIAKEPVEGALRKYGKELMAGLTLALLFGTEAAARAGARFAGGSDLDAAFAAQMAMDGQKAYMDAFAADLDARIGEFLASKWADEQGFNEGLEGLFDWARGRAKKYAVGAGMPAWREAVAGVAATRGAMGAIWVCTFAPTSCSDCLSLHGQFLTWEELRRTWGHTRCNGRCLCGIAPADDPEQYAMGELGTPGEEI